MLKHILNETGNLDNCFVSLLSSKPCQSDKVNGGVFRDCGQTSECIALIRAQMETPNSSVLFLGLCRSQILLQRHYVVVDKSINKWINE